MTALADRRRGNQWPTAQQALLLKVAAAPPEAAATAWEELEGELDLQTLEPGSFSLLPAVYRAAARLGAQGELVDRLKGIYRSTWYKNNLLLATRADVAAALHSAGIAAMAVGGLALASRYYEDVGIRPTPHLELLVRGPAELGDAADALGRHGWTPARDIRGTVDRVVLANDGTLCILRHDAFVFPSRGAVEDVADALWASATYEAPHGLRVAAPTGAFLAACATAVRNPPSPAVQWLLDAIVVARRDVEWDRVATVAVETGWPLMLRDVLRWLRAVAVAVPDAADERLAHCLSARERLARVPGARHAAIAVRDRVARASR